MTAQATIEGVQLTGGHEGQPELILRLRYPNGVASDVVVENALGVRLLAHCGAERLDDLVGEPWSRLVEILSPNKIPNRVT